MLFIGKILGTLIKLIPHSLKYKKGPSTPATSCCQVPIIICLINPRKNVSLLTSIKSFQLTLCPQNPVGHPYVIQLIE